ncbi:hypothetical protein GCK72_001596 [Caenorhabditis remanei]|uniref:Uncharacterized protein n=2 Tax=Caenorhabditis remanei TaxID=31234 RepID=A0A6A5HQ09_CAERE|nr:hypothetical protein GCK72_001596 [Caenorhabditis remanei]KAF1769779.1 hypothetical protein GCK72_001596 [Caenorhabditis remanei]
MISSLVHFLLVIQSIELVGESNKLDDYSDKIIVEGLEKQINDFDAMKAILINDIFKDEENLKVILSVRDQMGGPKSLRGTSINTEVSRKFKMRMDERSIHLSRDINTVASVDASKMKRKKMRENSKTAPEVSSSYPVTSKYNDCLKVLNPNLNMIS